MAVFATCYKHVEGSYLDCEFCRSGFQNFQIIGIQDRDPCLVQGGLTRAPLEVDRDQEWHVGQPFHAHDNVTQTSYLRELSVF